ncbi:MAG: hypothetical protein AAFU85_14020 [Planctomycetota bacterium]
MKNYVKIALIAFVALSLMSLLSLFLLARTTGSTVSAGRAEIQSAGDKVVYTEYATPPLPERHNAFYYLMRLKPYSDAFEQRLLANGEGTSSDLIPAGQQISPTVLKGLGDIVDETEEGFSLLSQAATAHGFRSEIDHSLGYGVLLTHGSLFRSAGRMLGARSIVLASRDQGDDALRTCIDGLKLQQLVSTEPMIVQWLMALSIQDQMLEAAHHVLVSTSTSDSVRDELDAVLASIDNQAGLVNALKAERAIGLLTFDQMRQGNVGEGVAATPLPGFLTSSWIGQAYLNDDEAAYIRIMNQLIELVGKPRTERTFLEEELFAELSDDGFRKVVTKMTVPALSQVVPVQESTDTKLRCLRIALRIQDQAEVDLESIPLAIRTDPVSRKPLIVARRPEGWLVYGVGENGKDDGGDFAKDPSRNAPFDIGFAPSLVPTSTD